MIAYVCTKKDPTSPTVAALVPPELNLNEKAEPPLEKVPVEPNGLVRVRTFPDTLQPIGDKIMDAEEREQEEVVSKVMDEGKVTLILESEGIACTG